MCFSDAAMVKQASGWPRNSCRAAASSDRAGRTSPCAVLQRQPLAILEFQRTSIGSISLCAVSSAIELFAFESVWTRLAR
jgi:hypothetical protein